MPLTGYSIWKTLGTELQLIHFNSGNYWCWYYSIEAGGYNVFDSHARDMYMYSEAMLNIVVYQTLIVTNVPVNSATL